MANIDFAWCDIAHDGEHRLAWCDVAHDGKRLAWCDIMHDSEDIIDSGWR